MKDLIGNNSQAVTRIRPFRNIGNFLNNRCVKKLSESGRFEFFFSHKMDLYNSLKAYISDKTPEKTEAVIEKVRLWQYLLSIATDHLSTFWEFFKLLNSYVELDPSFREEVPPSIKDSIIRISDTSLSIEERINNSKPLIVIAPFLPEENLLLLFGNVITIIQKYIEENKALPIDYLNHIVNFALTILDNSIVDKIFTNVTDLFDKPKGPAALAFFASISVDYYETEPEAADFVYQTVEKYIQKPEYILSTLYLILRFYNEERGSETFIKEKIIPLIAHKDEHVRYLVTRVLLSLISCQLINNIDGVNTVINLYPRCTNKKYFFKILKRFIIIDDSDDDLAYEIDEEIAETIAEFVSKTVTETEDIFVKGQCIDITSALGTSCSIYIDEIYQQFIDICVHLVKEEEYEAFPYISNYFLTLMKLFKSQAEESIMPSIPKLPDAILKEGSIKNSKRAFDLASNLAELTKSEDINCDFSSQLSQFVLKELSSNVLEDKLRACGTFLECPKKFNKETANEILKKILPIALTTDSYEKMDLLIMTFHKLIKLYDIPEDEFHEFNEKLVNGQLPLLNGSIPTHCIPLPEQLFDYMCDFCHYYPSNLIIIQNIIEWLDDKPEYAFGKLCEVLRSAIDCTSINDGMCTVIANRILTVLPHIKPKHEVALAADVISDIYKEYPASISPPDSFLDIFSKFIIDSDSSEEEEDEEEEKEEEEDEDEKDTSAKISFIKLILNVYVSEKNAKVDMDTVLHFFDFMPFDADEGFENVIITLDKAVSEDQRFAFAKMGLASLYSDMLINDDNSMDDFKESTIEMIKKSFSTIVKNDKSIENAVIEQVGKSKKAQMKLTDLLK
ncbi:hypothetical protein TRFO_08392 [Tritrichomonas foetus]|uniref:Uncharacterized protein n=1 Tax=Tritrichomonas foetus TaxID=1144522 RepID=A0A1J4JJW9_9EUKA|nr:hypothetical protein TRFO_08392 [Tritrichomonas foetus]|eukprot:OHS99454.1 hypothetical protein TRFO_08392 [Tritrichomonas foetus]